MPDMTGVHHINFSVPDLKKSTVWYSEVLGLTRLREMEDPQGRWTKIIFRHPGSGLVFGLTEHTSNTGERFSEFHTGMDHIAFAVSDRNELEAWSARFDQLGIEHSSIYQSAMGWVLVFRDPDNIQLEMYAPGM